MNTNNHLRDVPSSDWPRDRMLERLAVKASLGYRGAIESIAAAYAPVIELEIQPTTRTDATEKELAKRLESAILHAIPIRRLPRRRAVPWLYRVIRATTREVRWEHARDAGFLRVAS